jgi:predicted metal-dependent peptidase
MREAVIAAAQAVGADKLPGGVKRLIKDLTEPVVNWRELLEQQIQSTIKNDFTWARPSRRSWHMDAVLPGLKPGQQIDVCVAIDTSGSISEKDLKDFLSEVKGIMELYDEYKIHVITWDTAVHNPQVFTSENLDDIEAYEPGGGGGTDPHCVWEWLQQNEIEPKKLIMFTDFCFFGWSPEEVENYCETVWVIKGNRNAEPEFGVWAHYEEEASK